MRATAAAGVFCETHTLEATVIPAKAGIYSAKLLEMPCRRIRASAGMTGFSKGIPSQMTSTPHAHFASASETISENWAIPENIRSSFPSNRRRFSRTALSSAITSTLSKKVSTDGRSVEIASSANR